MNVDDLKKLSEKGIAWAQGRLGAYYVNGNEGLMPSAEMGHELLVRAAKQGHKQALYDAGYMYLEGVGCDVNVDNGLHFLTEAAKQYHTEAFLRLAVYAMNKIKDYEMAYYYFLIYLGCSGTEDEEEFETLDMIKGVLKSEVAKLTYLDAEKIINDKPLNDIELLDYSGVHVKLSLNDLNETQVSLMTEDEYLPEGLIAAEKLIEQMTS